MGEKFLDRLFAYHLYRECGGGVRRSRLFSEQLRNHLKGTPVLRKHEKDRETVILQGVSSDIAKSSKDSKPKNIVENQRESLKVAIQEKFHLERKQIPSHIY